MTIAVDLDEYHAFITNIPKDTFAKVTQEVKTLVLNGAYCPPGSLSVSKQASRLSVTRGVFLRLRSLTIDHSHFVDFSNYKIVALLPPLSDIPRLQNLTVKHASLSEETILSFLRHYGQHAQRMAIVLPIHEEIEDALQVIGGLHLENPVIEHSMDEQFRVHYIERGGNEELMNLEGFPQGLVQQAAEVVTLSPPSFKVALEDYWRGWG
ncbi:hypothetical protein G6011_02381 [Alternaria panax]|uniref:Uncharacterized protein n=1 Tax=Alternaria panax TaxID=48097 RepID=A0AAD4I781_9PLEO|nr:hypothetical protein G6011_02381 [Alternaria panax]